MKETENQIQQLSLDERNLRNLFYLSFRYSQGEASIQSVIFRWLSSEKVIKPYFLPEKAPKYILDLQIPEKHVAVSDKSLYGFEEMWNILYTTPYIVKNKNPIEDALVKNMIKRDAYFQVKKNLRAILPNTEPVEPDSPSDPHSSFIRRFGLNGYETGHPAFKKMFAVIGEKILALHQDESESEEKSPLKTLATKWERNHPGFSFFNTTE